MHLYIQYANGALCVSWGCVLCVCWSVLDVGCVSSAWVVKGLLPVLCIMHWRVWAVQRHRCISLERLLRASGAVGGEMHQVFCGPEQMNMKQLLDLSLSESSCPLRDAFCSISLHRCVSLSTFQLICLAHFHSVSLVLSTSYLIFLIRNDSRFHRALNVQLKKEKKWPERKHSSSHQSLTI